MSRKPKLPGWGRKPPTTDPNCPKRLWHHNGQKCEACGGVG